MQINDPVAANSGAEKSQAITRIVLTTVIYIYVIVNAIIQHPTHFSAWHETLIGLGYLAFSYLFLASIYKNDEPSPSRRIIGMTADLVTLSYVVYLTSPSGAILYPVYLWVIVGNGIRFGIAYLLTAMAIAAASFIVVMYYTPYWQQNLHAAVGLLFGLVLLPIFYSRLLRQLHSVNHRLTQQIKETVFSATHDPLTQLPNRTQFIALLEKSIQHSLRTGNIVGVMFIDLDRFKVVNDSLGHKAGDLVLQESAQRLSASIRPADTVCRISGDEFTVVLDDLAGATDAALIADRIIANFQKPMLIMNHQIILSASVGIAIYPTDTQDAQRLVEDADAAMYEAKALGRNRYVFYTQALNTQALARLEIEMDLRNALKNKEFQVHYQPRVNVQQRKIVGFEALLRWNHPQRGSIEPSQFIPLLEETGLIIPVGEWVIRQACKQCKTWQSLGYPKLNMSVNISSRQFNSDNLILNVQQALLTSGLAAEYLELELTESVLADDTDKTVKLLKALKHLGISLAIDDFGTGYSSLSYLMHFPIDHLKIDRSFVRDMTTNQAHASLTTAIIAMAQSLQLSMIAEGVETKEQLQFLSALGCQEMQGYLFGSPLPPEELTTSQSDIDAQLRIYGQVDIQHTLGLAKHSQMH